MALSKETEAHRKIIGQKIKQLRTISDTTQVELAKILGFKSTGTISQIENGERGMKAEKVMLAARHFGVPMQVIYDKAPMDIDDLEMILKLSEMIKLPPKKRPKKFKSIKELLSE